MQDRTKTPKVPKVPLTPLDETGIETGRAGINWMQLLLTVVVSVALVWVMLAQGCLGAPTKSQYMEDITRLETDLVQIRQDYALKTDIPAKPDLSNYVTKADLAAFSPDLTGYVTDAELATLTSEFKTLKADMATLEAELATLEATGVVTPTPTGKVSVVIVEETPLQIYSGGFNQFTVVITNNTNETKYVNYSVSFYCVNPMEGVAVNTLTITKSHPGITHTVSYAEEKAGCQQILCYFTADVWSGIPVSSGTSKEIMHRVDIATTPASWWEGDLAGHVARSW